jgi:hypothetical protein
MFTIDGSSRGSASCASSSSQVSVTMAGLPFEKWGVIASARHGTQPFEVLALALGNLGGTPHDDGFCRGSLGI